MNLIMRARINSKMCALQKNSHNNPMCLTTRSYSTHCIEGYSRGGYYLVSWLKFNPQLLLVKGPIHNITHKFFC